MMDAKYKSGVDPAGDSGNGEALLQLPMSILPRYQLPLDNKTINRYYFSEKNVMRLIGPFGKIIWGPRGPGAVLIGIGTQLCSKL